ncbi:MbtH family protein [Aureitalea sp. L0-47]|uniref:MbtH family protein n=1 Tax=Aureitalea sp. L0-47 TaxID=2816962 RepID=UPI0022373F7C|nr:MbtH family NRPS accessory protein [Aureitalea sp. L0-47]
MSKYLSIAAFFMLVINPSISSVSAQNIEEYQVVINHEEQYSIWLGNKNPPRGWKATGIQGNQVTCQKYIEEVWTDMRPLSIREMDLPEDSIYYVVINHEEQYSIWPKKLAIPEGWRATDFSGKLYPCVKYIKKVWTDMRPLSLQNRRG